MVEGNFKKTPVRGTEELEPEAETVSDSSTGFRRGGASTTTHSSLLVEPERRDECERRGDEGHRGRCIFAREPEDRS